MEGGGRQSGREGGGGREREIERQREGQRQRNNDKEGWGGGGGGGGVGIERERERENHFESFFILRMTVLVRGLIFQPVLLACTYNNDKERE